MPGISLRQQILTLILDNDPESAEPLWFIHSVSSIRINISFFFMWNDAEIHPLSRIIYFVISLSENIANGEIFLLIITIINSFYASIFLSTFSWQVRVIANVIERKEWMKEPRRLLTAYLEIDSIISPHKKIRRFRHKSSHIRLIKRRGQ